MGDRTFMQVYPYRCPTKRRQVAELLSGYVSAGHDRDETGDVVTGAEYTAEEVTCGSADDLAAQLIELAPRCSFVLWEDPRYEWLGGLHAYTPRLGHFEGECTSAGDVVLEASQIASVIREAARLGPMFDLRARGRRHGQVVADYDQIQSAVEVACGIPWKADWAVAASDAKPPSPARRRRWKQIIDANRARAKELS